MGAALERFLRVYAVLSSLKHICFTSLGDLAMGVRRDQRRKSAKCSLEWKYRGFMALIFNVPSLQRGLVHHPSPR